MYFEVVFPRFIKSFGANLGQFIGSFNRTFIGIISVIGWWLSWPNNYKDFLLCCVECCGAASFYYD